jgi:molybdopterin molybdotransferase
MNAPRVQMLPNCEGEDPDLLPVAEAYRRIDGSLVALNSHEDVPLGDALGRVLATPVMSPFDVPPHRNSAMDGYALSGDEIPDDAITTLVSIGTAWAGHPFAGTPGARECVRIMTGAPMPNGTDTVIMQEQVEADGDTIRIDSAHKRGQNVREAGEDIRAGAEVLSRGQRLGPAELGLVASLGQGTVQCFPRLKVAIFSTGDEVRSIGEQLEPGAIFDSNRYTLTGMLRRLDVELVDMGVLADNRDTIRTALDQAGREVDVIITSGGVSAGAADFVKTTLEELGQVGFWKIAIRPGRPLAFGRIHQAAFFGLPGNPVAVMVTFYQFVRAALRTLAGESQTTPEPMLDARLATRLRKKQGRVEYYRGVLERDDNDLLSVRTTGASGSGLLHTMSDANCFIVLPDDCSSLEPGAVVQVQPFFGLI